MMNQFMILITILNPEYQYDAMANDPPALKRKVIPRRILERYRILPANWNSFL